MFRNYWKSAIKSLWKSKTFTLINLLGLTVGLTCCLLLAVYIQHELSFDNFHRNKDRIARVIMSYSVNGGAPNAGNYTSTKVLPAFKNHFSEVENGVRMAAANKVVKYGDKLFNEKRFVFADSTFFQMFSFPLISGNPSTVLAHPNQLVITASTAKKYFGDKNPVGQSLLLGSAQTPFEVSGVAADLPSQSQIQFDFLASFSSLGPAQEDTYFNANYTTYLLLKNEASIAALQSKIPAFMKSEMSNEPTVSINYILEPFTRIHLYSPYDAFVPNGNITYLYIIGIIALLVLAIGCFTYINLSTAKSIERTKEVGIRKANGATKNQVFWQFICESFAIALLSLCLAFAACIILLPAFNQLTEKNLTATDFLQPSTFITAFGIVLIISFCAGSYPALILSRFKPVLVLKTQVNQKMSGAALRRSLVVFQFVISIFLISSTFIIKQQLAYIQNRNLGYNREQVLVLPADQKLIESSSYLKTEFSTNKNVRAVSYAYESPVKINGGYNMSKSIGNAEGENSVRANPVDEDYVKTTGLTLIAGTDFTKQDVTDATEETGKKPYYHFIINETAASALGWKPNEAIGKKLYLGEDRPGEVKAVIKDFHFESLHSKVEPLILFPEKWGNTILVKLSGNDITGTIAFLESKWKTIAPHRPFEYHFLDEEFNQLYANEMRTGNIFTIFSGITIVLACLGLFGLSAYSVRQRIKEIGVRKVLGASSASISLLLSKDFLKLVTIAIAIATPMAWWFAQSWLKDFAYRIGISWLYFAIAALLTIIIAVLTTGVQSVKAALQNPVRSLRNE